MEKKVMRGGNDDGYFIFRKQIYKIGSDIPLSYLNIPQLNFFVKMIEKNHLECFPQNVQIYSEYINKKNAYIFFKTQPNIDLIRYSYNENIILSSFTLEIYENFAEIYNVCTPIQYRKKGYSYSLLKSVINNKKLYKNRDYYIWLGVDTRYINMGSSTEENILKTIKRPEIDLYKKLGFIFNGLGHYSPSNSIYQHTYLMYTMIHTNPYYDSNSSNKIIIPYNNASTLKWLQKGLPIYINKQKQDVKEISGFITSFIKHNVMTTKDIHTLNFDNVCETDIVHEFTQPELTKGYTHIYFHTHPISCYRELKIIIGWPSSRDVRASFLYAKTLLKKYFHLVITKEGIYLIHIINSNINSMDLNNAITEMEEMEKVRSFQLNKNIIKVIQKYLIDVNKLLFVNNIKYAEVLFVDWNKIENNQVAEFLLHDNTWGYREENDDEDKMEVDEENDDEDKMEVDEENNEEDKMEVDEENNEENNMEVDEENNEEDNMEVDEENNMEVDEENNMEVDEENNEEDNMEVDEENNEEDNMEVDEENNEEEVLNEFVNMRIQ